jgi:hypothetical protein
MVKPKSKSPGGSKKQASVRKADNKKVDKTTKRATNPPPFRVVLSRSPSQGATNQAVVPQGSTTAVALQGATSKTGRQVDSLLVGPVDQNKRSRFSIPVDQIDNLPIKTKDRDFRSPAVALTQGATSSLVDRSTNFN